MLFKALKRWDKLSGGKRLGPSVPVTFYHARISVDTTDVSRQAGRTSPCDWRSVEKMVDFGRRTYVSHLRRRGVSRAAAPTVQGGSAWESHPRTPIGSPLKPLPWPQPAGQPEPNWVCLLAFPAGAALQAPVSAVPERTPTGSIRASPASLQVR